MPGGVTQNVRPLRLPYVQSTTFHCKTLHHISPKRVYETLQTVVVKTARADLRYESSIIFKQPTI